MVAADDSKFIEPGGNVSCKFYKELWAGFKADPLICISLHYQFKCISCILSNAVKSPRHCDIRDWGIWTC